MRICCEDYDHALAASKPSAMTLRLLDKLFTKETLLWSTLYGTKEFAALYPSQILAIKGKLSKQGITANVIQNTIRTRKDVQNSPKIPRHSKVTVFASIIKTQPYMTSSLTLDHHKKHCR